MSLPGRPPWALTSYEFCRESPPVLFCPSHSPLIVRDGEALHRLAFPQASLDEPRIALAWRIPMEVFPDLPPPLCPPFLTMSKDTRVIIWSSAAAALYPFFCMLQTGIFEIVMFIFPFPSAFSPWPRRLSLARDLAHEFFLLPSGSPPSPPR